VQQNDFIVALTAQTLSMDVFKNRIIRRHLLDSYYIDL
jgi:hypothetical protein